MQTEYNPLKTQWQKRFNWNSCGTIGAVQAYFAKVLTKGPISRINFCTIPEREIGAEQPVYGIYDEKFDQELKPYLKNLTEANGVMAMLPDEFTYQDAVNLRLKEGKSKDQTMSMLNQWVHREYIVRVTELSFKKLKYKTNESRSN